jgi:NADPH2:quinone reductase
MKFVEASKFGGPEVLTVVESPTPTPTVGALLVQIKAVGVNYADIMARSGFYPQVPKAPFPVGFEIAGVVKGIGKSVEGFKEGDSVAAIIQGGGYATHAVIPAATAIPLPAGLDHALAVAVLVQGVTAYILLDEVKVKEGDAVLVSAAGGGLGNLAVQLAKAPGCESCWPYLEVEVRGSQEPRRRSCGRLRRCRLGCIGQKGRWRKRNQSLPGFHW